MTGEKKAETFRQRNIPARIERGKNCNIKKIRKFPGGGGV
jgi:hypothetical protein